MSSPKGGYVGLAGNRPGSYSPTARSPQGSVAFGRGATASTSSNNKLRRMRSNTPTPSDRPATPRASPEETPRSPVPPAQAPSPPGAAPGAPATDPGSRQAITIFGCTGKYKLINDTFEPLQMLHQNKPCWRARSATPVYLFHTGKSRWVISKKVNDGARCYAFVSDNGYADPTQCPGPWICCGEDGQWREDRNIKCVPAKASQDKFVLLRNEVEEDLKHFGLMDSNSLKQLWKKLDKNGNNIVSLAEIDSLVVDMVKASLWPEWVNNKDAIRRAYEKTAKLDGDGEGDDVEKEEFHSLLLNLFWFGHLHRIFDEIDTSHDGRLTLEEFTAGMAQLDLHLSPEEARREYSTIDMDHGGMILFTEFCAYIRRRVHPDHNPAFDADIVSKDKSNETLRKKHGDKATHGHFVNKKSLADFDKLEKELKDVLKANDQAQLKKMWKRLDFNGNNIVSLAEVGKMVNEQYPVLNHQPALMRAFKATLERGNGDEWVQKAEFKMLLGNLFYFNKLYWLFDQVDEDHDRRMTLKEFQWCMSVCGIKMSQAKSEAEFKKVDVNGGGIILFDEFCRYFADKHCPEAMQEFVDGL